MVIAGIVLLVLGLVANVILYAFSLKSFGGFFWTWVISSVYLIVILKGFFHSSLGVMGGAFVVYTIAFAIAGLVKTKKNDSDNEP